MSSILMPTAKLPFHLSPKPHQSNTKSVQVNFPLHHSFNTAHFKNSRVFITSSGSYRSRTKAATKDQYAVKQNAESFYDLLGIGTNESFSEIKRAYKQLARKYHPDASPADQVEEYTRRFIQVQEAYETLSDPRARALYDRDMSLPVQCNKRWGDWKIQLKELEWRSMNKNSRGNTMSWAARIRNCRQGRTQDSIKR
ncbi:hypothetical protein LguiB_000502 [Lonicera macranthoides]